MSRFGVPLDVLASDIGAPRAGILCKLSAVESEISSSRSRSGRVARVWQVLLLAVSYAIVARIGLLLTGYNDDTTLVWPPAGLSLAALILFGRHLWPGIFLGMMLVRLSSPLGWMPMIGIGIGHTLEAVVGVTLLVRVADFRPNMERVRDGAAFLLIGVVGCTTVGATIGSVSVLLSGNIEVAEFGRVWRNWWMGASGGVLVLTPILLMSVHGTPSWGSLVRRRESWFALGSLLATSSFVFLGPDLGILGFAASLAPFTVLVWAGTRLGPRGAVIASFLSIVIATIATGAGVGPFVVGTRTETMFQLWSYSIFIALAAFTLASVSEQRDAAERRYRSEETDRLRAEKQKLLLLERERLAREMHDGLGGQLVSALSMVERGSTDSDEVAEVLRRAIDEIGIVIDSLDPDTTNLSTSLGKLRARLEPLLSRNGIDLEWRLDDIPELDTFPPEAALHVLRIIQEAVTNTLRHAGADSAEVRIVSTGDEGRQLHVSIRDDGRGLPMQMSLNGRGINNMKFRAEKLGAALRIDGASSGTRIDLTVPFPC
jgi:signal transduction histidine kinase